jgi:hypothetical protein
LSKSDRAYEAFDALLPAERAAEISGLVLANFLPQLSFDGGLTAETSEPMLQLICLDRIIRHDDKKGPAKLNRADIGDRPNRRHPPSNLRE